MEAIIDYLKRNLRAAGCANLEAIAKAAGVAKSLPRKIAYNNRKNPGVQTVQPLLDYFHRLEAEQQKKPEGQ